MNTTRLEAFSDGVLAIIITITVLGIRIPAGPALTGLLQALPTLVIYAWSFQTVGIYWNNHHQLLLHTDTVSSSMMWANLNLLFWLSLIPFTTEWLGENLGATWPTVAYATILFLAAVAYTILEYVVAAHQKRASKFSRELSQSYKEWISLGVNGTAVACGFFNPWLSYFFIVAVSLIWLLPDRRGLR